VSDPSLEALLEVQAHDLVIDQLRHRRAALPERAALRAQSDSLVAVRRRRADNDERAHDLERRQRRLEDETELVVAKATDSEGRLYSGTVVAPRELQALSAEVDGLRRRQRGFEDEVLELMEAREPVEAERTRLVDEEESLRVEGERLVALLVAGEGEIDGLIAAELVARDGLAQGVPADLLATYEGLRRRLDGVGVARVEAGRCTGCHLGLSAVELDHLRRVDAGAGAAVRHEECGRILVP
jgi:predicted  nucleic acid-binding Zn-ribbon protein